MKEAAYKKYLLALLLLIVAFNGIDGPALALLLQSIKLDFDLSDTQLGFLTGMAFAVFYSVMGIPLARWADRGDRVTIIALTLALFSVMVTLCGWAGSFTQLLLLRIGVAVGEAGCVPSAHSLIPDYFSRAERPRAVAVFMLGGSLSVMIGYFAVGWLNELYGWRTTYMVLGLPGLALAVLAGLTLREPRRGPLSGSLPGGSRPQPNLIDVSATLWTNVTFRHLVMSFSLMCFLGNGIGQWQPAFLIRSHGMNTGQLGTWFAIIYGVGGFLGTYGGGALASRYAADNERLQLRAMALVYFGVGIVSAFVFLSPSRNVSFLLMGIAAAGIATASGPLLATIQTLVPAHMRATAVAILYFFANLIGMGLGPLAAGILSDTFRPWAAEQSLRYTLLALCPGYWFAAWYMLRASATVAADLPKQLDQVKA